MKKRVWLSVFLLFVVTMAGCRQAKEKQIELLDASHELMLYAGTEEADAFAVDEVGQLYTIQDGKRENSDSHIGEYVYEPWTQLVSVYDLTGACIHQMEIGLGNGEIRIMTAENGMLYCAANKSYMDEMNQILYAVDVNTWEVMELAVLEGFGSVYNLVRIGDYFYVAGKAKVPEVKDYVLPEGVTHNYLGEIVGRVNVTEEKPQMEIFAIDFPIDIAATSEGSLIIYQFTEEKGFGYLEFNPQEGTLEETGWKFSAVANRRFTSCEDGYLCLGGQYLQFGTARGEETQITAERVSCWIPPVYQKGFAFYKNEFSGVIERICVGDILKKNRTIRMLMHQDIMDEPFGCGYRMEETVLSTEQFALKVLAQDSDFDICLLSSRNPASYNLKVNGAFYPLNEVDGVEEYLDACFPYLKEVATNEDGDIWMLPVKLAIPALTYNREYCESNGVDLDSMDYLEFLDFTSEMEINDTEKTSISSMIAAEQFFGQYLSCYETFDTELFRTYAKLFRDSYLKLGNGWFLDIFIVDALERGELPEFYYTCKVYEYDLTRYSKLLGTSDALGLTGIPTLSEDIGNTGTLTFLAVNPQSEELETTLEYISAFAKYMMTKKDSFLLADEAMYTDTPFMKDWYRMCADGAVYFEMEDEIYWNLFTSYVKGEIELEEMVTEVERKRKIYMGE